MPELSIIVPVYKVEKYLPRCIDSILAQTFGDFELILIDDGSPDGCGRICDEYARKDKRIVVIHQKNMGVSAARNAGLDIARGRYIGFVDSDDWIEPQMYEVMMREARASAKDIIACGICYYGYDDNRIMGYDLSTTENYSSIQAQEDLFAKPSKIGGCIWNKLYKQEIAILEKFDTGIRDGEDRHYLIRCYSRSNGVRKIGDILCDVFIRPNSASRTDNPQKLYEALANRKKLAYTARQYSRRLYALAIDRYIDDGIRYFIPKLERVKKENCYRCTLITAKVYLDIFSHLIIAALTGAISKGVAYGYLRMLLEKHKNRRRLT